MKETAVPAPEHAAESWGLRTGDEIDETLVVIRPLGGGTRYEVFEAWDRLLFTRVAVKVIRPHRIHDDHAQSGLEREAALAGRLAHPHLVRLLRWSPALPRPHIVLELITAQSVEDHLEDVGPVSVPETCVLGIRMLSALHYLHSQSILHLDVKPGNVTMGAPPRLLDLSLARTASGAVKLDSSMGTPAYMAPEQCAHGYVSAQTDLFGLGATLYEAMSGMQPFSAGDENDLDRTRRYPQLVEDAVPLGELIEGIPSPLERVVMACLQRDPARRPRSAGDAAIALHETLEAMRHEDLLVWPRGFTPRV
jgi:serine/threonine protein kinase